MKMTDEERIETINDTAPVEQNFFDSDRKLPDLSERGTPDPDLCRFM